MGTVETQLEGGTRAAQHGILAHRFAQGSRTPDQIEDVVGDLVRLAEQAAQRSPSRRVAATRERAGTDRRFEQRAGLGPMVEPNVRMGLRLPRLTCDDSSNGTDAGRDDRDHRAELLCVLDGATQDFVGGDDESVAGQHRELFAKLGVDRRPTSSNRGIVEARQVVMDQGGAVQELQGHGRRFGSRRIFASRRIGDSHSEARPNTCATGEEGVVHRGSKPGRRAGPGHRVEGADQGCLDGGVWGHAGSLPVLHSLSRLYTKCGQTTLRSLGSRPKGKERAMYDVMVIGGGVGGLSAALRLAGSGASVAVLEKAPQVGGKMRTVSVRGHAIDAGPTVLTMRPVFEELFEAVGLRMQDFVTLRPLQVLARHGWADGSRLDLHADPEQSARAIETMSGRAEAQAFLDFCEHTRRLYQRVENVFIHGEHAGMIAALKRAGLTGSLELLKVDWHKSLWKSLRSFFRDPRLRQLFARYATYYGSSPFEAPGTLALIAHVEQSGVWTVEGGMINLALGLRRALESQGGKVFTGVAVSEVLTSGGRVSGVRSTDGTQISARTVIVNADPRAVERGCFGEAASRAVSLPAKAPRSLSAMTFCGVGRVHGFELGHHNVFFSTDYADEFDRLFHRGALPAEPTVYVCAQSRDAKVRAVGAAEPLFCLVNAPPIGDRHDFHGDIEACRTSMVELLHRCGATLELEDEVITTPHHFERMFPATGGSLYGPATHGPTAAFSRPGVRTKLPGMYLVGGGVHPGAGVPMVALSGRAAAAAVVEDLASISPFPMAATPGGTSTGSATTGGMQ